MEVEVEFRGGNLDAFDDTTSREYLISGPAGTGKTFVNLVKLLQFGGDHPGSRLLIVRKTRHSLTETALVTWERDVLGSNHEIIAKPIDRGHRHSYKFGNGSVLVTGGMDRPDKVLSSEWDMIYVPEATDLTLTDWETLGGRLRAAAGPYDQLFGDCNPTTPHHWLYKRCQAGKCKLYETTHRDNPRYYDVEKRKWTDAGIRYIRGRLQTLTGHRRDRFLYGKWVSAEGLVYDNYVPEAPPKGHLLPRDWKPPKEWPRVWGIDWGHSAPTVLQFWAVDPDVRMYLYREVYRTHLRADVLGKWAAKEINDGRETRPKAVVCDHDPEKKELFEAAAGLRVELADKADRDKGIQEVQARFDFATDGKPRLFIRDGARDHEPDSMLVAEGRPTSTLEELVGYAWDPDFLADEPIAENDHGMDAARYSTRKVNALFGPSRAAAGYGTNRITDPHHGLNPDVWR